MAVRGRGWAVSYDVYSMFRFNLSRSHAGSPAVYVVFVFVFDFVEWPENHTIRCVEQRRDLRTGRPPFQGTYLRVPTLTAEKLARVSLWWPDWSWLLWYVATASVVGNCQAEKRTKKGVL